MAALTDEVKEFIVRGLARYETPSNLADAVRETFGVEITRQQVYRYDPDCTQPPAQRWRDLHAVARGAFLDEVAGIGIAHKAVRLQLLERMMKQALAHNYTDRAACFLEQVAKECGGVYEGRKSAVPAPKTPAPLEEPGRSGAS